MIPTLINEELINIDTNVVNNASSKTYYINFDERKIQSEIDGLEAVKQAVYMILNTEKESYVIYPFDYGISLEKYIGKPHDYVIADIGREIKESLLKDSRILNVENFEYIEDGNKLTVKFTVITIYGELEEEVKV